MALSVPLSRFTSRVGGGSAFFVRPLRAFTIMSRPVQPTDESAEQTKGRVALWLDPEDLRWLSQHCCCSPDAEKTLTERCARVRFRANAALHKAGLKSDTGSL